MICRHINVNVYTTHFSCKKHLLINKLFICSCYASLLLFNSTMTLRTYHSNKFINPLCAEHMSYNRSQRSSSQTHYNYIESPVKNFGEVVFHQDEHPYDNYFQKNPNTNNGPPPSRNSSQKNYIESTISTNEDINLFDKLKSMRERFFKIDGKESEGHTQTSTLSTIGNQGIMSSRPSREEIFEQQQYILTDRSYNNTRGSYNEILLTRENQQEYDPIMNGLRANNSKVLTQKKPQPVEPNKLVNNYATPTSNASEGNINYYQVNPKGQYIEENPNQRFPSRQESQGSIHSNLTRVNPERRYNEVKRVNESFSKPFEIGNPALYMNDSKFSFCLHDESTFAQDHALNQESAGQGLMGIRLFKLYSVLTKMHLKGLNYNFQKWKTIQPGKRNNGRSRYQLTPPKSKRQMRDSYNEMPYNYQKIFDNFSKLHFALISLQQTLLKNVRDSFYNIKFGVTNRRSEMAKIGVMKLITLIKTKQAANRTQSFARMKTMVLIKLQKDADLRYTQEIVDKLTKENKYFGTEKEKFGPRGNSLSPPNRSPLQKTGYIHPPAPSRDMGLISSITIPSKDVIELTQKVQKDPDITESMRERNKRIYEKLKEFFVKEISKDQSNTSVSERDFSRKSSTNNIRPYPYQDEFQRGGLYSNTQSKKNLFDESADSMHSSVRMKSRSVAPKSIEEYSVLDEIIRETTKMSPKKEVARKGYAKSLQEPNPLFKQVKHDQYGEDLPESMLDSTISKDDSTLSKIPNFPMLDQIIQETVRMSPKREKPRSHVSSSQILLPDQHLYYNDKDFLHNLSPTFFDEKTARGIKSASTSLPMSTEISPRLHTETGRGRPSYVIPNFDQGIRTERSLSGNRNEETMAMLKAMIPNIFDSTAENIVEIVNREHRRNPKREIKHILYETVLRVLDNAIYLNKSSASTPRK